MMGFSASGWKPRIRERMSDALRGFRHLARSVDHRAGEHGVGGGSGFLDLGGEVRCQDLTRNIIRRYLNRAIPILTGLSATCEACS